MIAARITGSIVLFFFTMVNHQIHWPDRHVMRWVFLNGSRGHCRQYVLYPGRAVGRLDVAAVLGSLIRVRRFYWQGWCCMNG